MQKANYSASTNKFALFTLGFRPFFLLATVFSIISMSIWTAVYTFGWPSPVTAMSPFVWHGHEMVFGYTVGVIAGFLLTAVRNWTGVQTIHGLPLFFLVAIWLFARVLPLFNLPMLFKWAAILDIVFLTSLMLAIIYPIVKAKQWRQLMIAIILIMFMIANSVYYFGVLYDVEESVSQGLYSGIYLIMLLVSVIAGRVIPFFVERAVGYHGQLKKWSLTDKGHLPLLVCLWLVDIFFKQALLAALLSFLLAIAHSIRLYGWYVGGIWKKPLLWSLFIGYGFFVISFALKAFAFFVSYPESYALHAFTYGSIGIMTVAMMARVSLGHTGRNVNQPPAVLAWVFSMLCAGTIIRVLVPIILPTAYLHLIGLSQLLWIGAFALFFRAFFSVFIYPSIK